MKVALLAGLLALAPGLFAQTAIPSGTILPLRLNSSLNSRKSKPGQVVTARLMQDVPLPSGERIRAGAKVIGRVREVSRQNGGGTTISLQFDTLQISKRTIPITANLRALASMMEVEEAQLPATGPDRGTSENSWITQQIGGDIVYRGGGPVANGSGVVGTPTADGVLVQIVSQPGTKCRGDFDGNDHPQALWLFSSDACGTYGFADLTILHAGRSNPVGLITLASGTGDFDVRSGSGLLLRVQ
ncbi:MAG: hypothetical protein WB510_10345 [Candidatus Sulfotelmatobacter sp.]